MKRWLNILLLAGVYTLFVQCHNNDPESTAKVIIDSDMVETFDDGVGYLLLAKTPDVDILGVTTVTGNTWAAEGLAYAMRLGELMQLSNTQYVQGEDAPTRPGRLDNLNNEIDANPGTAAYWRGSVSYQKVDDWRAFYQSHYATKPASQPADIDVAAFIAQQVMQHPGEITLLAIGPCTNIAKALTMNPEIAQMVKEIVYMGGALYCEGNTTSYAELNFLYDPEAAAICLRAPFPKQTLVSLDVCNTVVMDSLMFFDLYKAIPEGDYKQLFEKQYIFEEFSTLPAHTSLVWDVISAALIVDKTLIKNMRTIRIDVDDNPTSPTYGRCFETDNQNCQSICVPMEIDNKRIFSMIKSALGAMHS